MNEETEAAAVVIIQTNWLHRGRLRRLLKTTSLDFTEDRKLFRATFQAKLTADQYDTVMTYWMQNPDVHVTKSVV